MGKKTTKQNETRQRINNDLIEIHKYFMCFFFFNKVLIMAALQKCFSKGKRTKWHEVFSAVVYYRTLFCSKTDHSLVS